MRMASAVETRVDDLISSNKVMIFSKTYCPYCKMAKDALASVGAHYETLELDNDSDGNGIQDYLLRKTGARSVPRVFINGTCIGGGSETQQLQKSGKLEAMIGQ